MKMTEAGEVENFRTETALTLRDKAQPTESGQLISSVRQHPLVTMH